MSVTFMPMVWAYQLIRLGRREGVVPPYGSAAWLELPDSDRRKVAACVIAAEAWRCGENRVCGSESVGRGGRARRIAEARQPRAEDFPGGSVRWDAVNGQ